jgi:hypothetical protein
MVPYGEGATDGIVMPHESRPSHKESPQLEKGRRTFGAYRASARAAHKRALEQQYGTLGPASPVRRIDPVTGRVIEIIQLPTTSR